jgi:hypothetical protein
VAFNHYAKLRRIIEQQPSGWVIMRINRPTRATNFKGETIDFPCYYRLYSRDGKPIKYGKFQQIERLAKALDVPVEALPVIEEDQL